VLASHLVRYQIPSQEIKWNECQPNGSPLKQNYVILFRWFGMAILSCMIQALVLASRHESYTMLANAQKEMLKYVLVLYTLSFFTFLK
jgi:hypothetical protein